MFGLRPNVGGHVLPHDLTDVIAAHEANGAALMVGSNCTRPRNTAGHRIASLPTSHLLLCMDSQTRHPEQRFTPPIFFLTGVYLPRPARRLSAPRQPTLRGAFCFDNSRTRAGPRGAQEPHRTAAGARTGEPQSKVGVGIRPSSRGREIRIRLGVWDAAISLGKPRPRQSWAAALPAYPSAHRNPDARLALKRPRNSGRAHAHGPELVRRRTRRRPSGGRAHLSVAARCVPESLGGRA